MVEDTYLSTGYTRLRMFLLADSDAIAVGTLLVTIVLAAFTGVYVHLTYRLVQAASDPCVIVYTDIAHHHITEFVVVIENIGKGVARDIRFELRDPIPRQFSKSEHFTDGPLVDGIAALAPGGKRFLPWGV